MQGLVTKFFARPRKGKYSYGFIDGYDGETYFFNQKGLLTKVKVGDEVKFKARFGEKGSFAKDVEVISQGGSDDGSVQ